MPGALDGLRVIEAGQGVGPSYCGKLLAGFGAEVIKIEPPEGDVLRQAGPFPGDLPDPERSGLFLHLNTGKRSAAPKDDGEIEALLEEADALILAHRPSELRGTVFEIERLRERYPSLVVANVSWFGLDGPYAEYLGNELVAYALGGYAILTGSPEREPIKSYGSLVEYQAGTHAALGVLAALHERRSSGLGQIVDVSAMEASTFLIGGVEQNGYFYGKAARRNGTRLLGFPAHHSYPSTIRPCADGYVHCHSHNRYLDLLGSLIPNPRLLEPDLLETMMGHADEIDGIMDPWLADKTRHEIVKMAQELRLPFTEVMEPGEVMADEHHKARGSFVTIEHAAAGPVLQPGAPVHMSATPWRNAGAPAFRDFPTFRPSDSPSRPLSDRRTSRPSQVPGQKPLSGVRVIDFTNAVAGPIASYLLADLGADVIKVEGPASRPLHAAGTAPLQEGSERAGYDRIMIFNQLNHGKRSLVLDAARPEGREVFLELVRKSDIVVQNFSPRVMPNLGLDYETLKAANPGIILVSMPAFGLSGPYRDRISYGPGIDAMSGLSHLTGYEDGPPMKPGNFFCDQNAGLHAAVSALAALWHQRETGDGQHVELAMIEGEFQVLGDAYIDYAFNGRERRRIGNKHPAMAPHDVFRCKGEDAWVAIAVENDAQFRALCEVIGRAELASDPRFADATSRKSNEQELVEPITAWTGGRTHLEAQDALQAAGVPAGAALDVIELFENPHVRARDGIPFVETPGIGPAPCLRMAFRLSGRPLPIAGPAPCFGDANDDVLSGLLGLRAERIGELERLRVTSRVPLAP